MRDKKDKKHPGFKAVEKKIEERSGVSRKEAGAILASAARRASPAARRKNPRLAHVKGKSRSEKKSRKHR